MNSNSSSLDPRVPKIKIDVQTIFDILANLQIDSSDIQFTGPFQTIGSDANGKAIMGRVINDNYIDDQSISTNKIIGLDELVKIINDTLTEHDGRIDAIEAMFPLAVIYNEYNEADDTWSTVTKVLSNTASAWTFLTDTAPKMWNASKNIYAWLKGARDIVGVSRNLQQINDTLDETTRIANDASDLIETTTDNLRNTNKKINDVADELGFDPTKEPGEQLTDWNNVLDEIGYDEGSGTTQIKRNVESVTRTANDALSSAGNALTAASSAASTAGSIASALVGAGGNIANSAIAGGLAGLAGGLLGALFTGGDSNEDGTINPLKGIYDDQIKDLQDANEEIQIVNNGQNTQITNLFQYLVDGGFLINNNGTYTEAPAYAGIYSKIVKLINNDANYATQLNKLGIVNTNLTTGTTSLTNLPNIKIPDLISYLVTSGVLIATTDANNVTTYTPNTNIAGEGGISSLTSNNILIGDSAGKPKEVIPSGDVTIDNNGLTTLDNSRLLSKTIPTVTPTNTTISLTNGDSFLTAFNKIQGQLNTIQSGGYGNLRSVMMGCVNTAVSGVTTGDHVQFNGVTFSQGTNITLNTSSTYNTSQGTESLGRITLKANKTYKLLGSVTSLGYANNGDYAAIVWYNADIADNPVKTAHLGSRANMITASATSTFGMNGMVAGFITTTVDTRVELRFTYAPSGTSYFRNDPYGGPWFCIEEVGAYGYNISTSLLNGNIFVGDANNTPKPVIPTGDVTIDNTGVTTLSTTNLLAKTIPNFTPSDLALTNGDTLQTFINKTQGQIDTIKINSPSATRSLMLGYVNLTQTANFTLFDHIKFDKVAFTQGSNIRLADTTTYTSTINVESLGRITLKKGSTYKLFCMCNGLQTTGSGDNVTLTRWYNADTGEALNGGIATGSVPPASLNTACWTSGTIAYITTTVDTRVELRFTNANTSGILAYADARGGTYFTAEEVGTNVGIAGITTLTSGNIYLGDANNTPQPVIPSGDVTITNTGVTTLSTTALLAKTVPTITPTTTNTAVVSNDSLLTIINKLQGQINLLTANISVKNILHGYCSNGTTVSVGSRIPFNTNRYTRGSGISLDANTGTVGQIILRSATVNKSYRLIGSINNAIVTTYGATCWYSSTGTVLGVVSGAGNPSTGCNRSPSFTIAYIDVSANSADVRVELRCVYDTIATNPSADSIGPAWFTVEEI